MGTSLTNHWHAAGSEGVLCNECAVGSVGLGGTCIRCHSSVLSVFAILVLPTSVLLIITVLTSVLLQGTPCVVETDRQLRVALLEISQFDNCKYD